MKKIYIIVVLAFGLCACNKEESIQKTPEEAPVVYHMSIPASFGAQAKSVTFDADGSSITTQFETTDKIYVYNETKGAFARSADGEHLLSYLQPSTSGSSCTLTGDLSFYRLNSSDEWESVTVEAGDTYSLFYQMNDPDYYYSSSVPIPRFDYSQQDGSASKASHCDFAEANGVIMILSGATLTVPDNIPFNNLQSMFRQRLSFTKGGVAVSPKPTITKLTVATKNDTFLEYYRPDRPDQDGDNGKYWAFDGFDIDNPVITSDGDIFLSLAFYYPGDTATGDQLILTATDDEGNIYQGAKNVPSGGFKTSKYYHGGFELAWQKQMIMPTVTRSDGGDPDELEPYDGLYDISGDPAEITISGDSMGYIFNFDDSAIVTLTGNGTARSTADNNDFICVGDNLTIELDSDYTIICPEYGTAIYSYEDLKLKTTGGVQTLSVTTNDEDNSGIYGWNNYDKGISGDVSALAVDGFTVTCSATVDNGDGTYTWIYTVAPNNVGKIMGADGVVYTDVVAATSAGTTAEAMIAFVGRIDGVCTNGLAISLTDAYEYNATYAEAIGAVIISSWKTYHPVPGGTWRLPSEKDWQYMMWGYYTDSPVAAPIGTISSVLSGGYYWTSTEIDNDNAKGIYFDGTSNASVQSLAKTGTWHVRACLSF